MRKFVKYGKWPVLFILLIFLYLGMDYSLRHIAILPGFLELELQEAEKDLKRCINAIQREQHHVKQQAVDWAEFDDMFEYVLRQNQDFENANLQMKELSKAGIDMIYITDIKGKIIWSGVYDRVKTNFLQLAELPQNKFAENHPLVIGGENSPPGILITEHGPLLVASYPILPTSGQGPPRGTLIMGSFLFADVIEELRENIRIDFTIDLLNSANKAAETQLINTVLASESPIFKEEGSFLNAYTLLNDIHDKPAILLTARLPRTILEKGRQTALFSSINILVVFSFVLLFGLLWFSLFRSRAVKAHEKIEQLVTTRTEELKESEQRFSVLSDAAFEAIFFSEKGICILQNKTASKMFGYSDEEAIGMPGTNWIIPEDRELVMQNIINNSETPYYVTALRKDGSTFPAEIQGRPLVYRGKPVRITSLRDITDRKKSEAEKASLEERLRHLQRMEAIGLMAGGVAHDLNNILSGIVVYPEILLAQLPKNSELRPPLEATKKAGLRAAEVVSDLLTVARGVSSLQEVANLNTIISEYLQSPEYEKLKSHHSNVQLKLGLSPSLANFICSAVHVRKCVMNLITNGCEAVGQKGQIEINTNNRDVDQRLAKLHSIEPGNYVVLLVKDTGPGISREDIGRIFEPFYTKKTMGRSGTGLGLSVVWNTVQDHKGAVDVRCDESGTTFELFFPSTDKQADIASQAHKITELSGNMEEILVVDDDPLQRDIAAQILQTINYNAATVSSGEDALLYLENKRADLVILDMLMEPGMSGADTYLKIREQNPSQKAIIVSGYSRKEEIENARNLGIEIFLKKPYTLEQIGKAIKDALR